MSCITAVVRESLPLLVPFFVPDGFSDYTTIYLCPERLYNHLSLCPTAPRDSSVFEFSGAVQGYGKGRTVLFNLTHFHMIIECDNQHVYW